MPGMRIPAYSLTEMAVTSIFEDNSLDAIITDHPYQLNSSLKGGNRNFADYGLFKYTEKRFF